MSDIARLEALMIDFGNSMKQVQSDIGDIKSDVSVLKSDVSELKSDVSVLKSDVSVLKFDVSELKSDVSVLKSDVSELKSDMTSVKGRLGSLEETMYDFREEFRSESAATRSLLNQAFEHISDQIAEPDHKPIPSLVFRSRQRFV
jgi:chromosome segregation ATPase